MVSVPYPKTPEIELSEHELAQIARDFAQLEACDRPMTESTISRYGPPRCTACGKILGQCEHDLG